VAKPPIFNGEAGKVSGFLITCGLLIKIKMRNDLVEKQV